MKSNYKFILEKRLKFFQEWQNEWKEYFKYQDINQKVKVRYYQDKKILSFCLQFYFMPINILRFLKKRRAIHSYQKVLTTIDVLKEELAILEQNNKPWEKNDRR